MAPRKPPQAPKKAEISLVLSSAAEYLTFVADNELAHEATSKQYLMVQNRERAREVKRKIALQYVLVAQE